MEFLVSIINFILNIINSLGYWGIFIGMTIESSLFPFPSEILLIPAGALITQGLMKFWPIFFAGVAGSLLGAYFNYFLALFVGRKPLERFAKKRGSSFFLSKEKLARADNYFKKHGEITTFLARLIPGVRQIISLPAGFAKMNFLRFTIFTLLGASIWTAILIYIGYFFANNAEIVRNYAVLILLVICVIIILAYIIFRKLRERRKINSLNKKNP